MKKRLFSLATFVLVSALLAGCGAVSAGDMKVLNGNVRESSLAQESMLQVKKLDGHVPKIDTEYDGLRAGEIFYNNQGKSFKYDLATMETQQVGEMEFYDLSTNGNRALASVKNQFYVMDFTTGKYFLVGTEGEDYEYYFADAEGTEVFYIGDENNDIKINLIEVDTQIAKSWTLTDFDTNNFIITAVVRGVAGAYLPFYDNGTGKETGLYHLDWNGEITKVNELTGIETLQNFEFLTEDKIIFNEIYNGVSGVYTLDLTTNEVTLLFQGGEDKEGTWVPFYLVSPDKTKIVFDMPVQVGKEYKANIYVGNLTEEGVTDITTVDINKALFAVIQSSATWSNDSQRLYVATNKEQQPKIDVVEVYEITTK